MTGRALKAALVPAPPARRLGQAAWAAAGLAGTAALGAWAGVSLDPESGPLSVRMAAFLNASALVVAAPHLLFPDPAWRTFALVDPAPEALWGRSLRRWTGLVAGAATFVSALGMWSGAGLLGVESVLVVVGIGLVAWARYVKLGATAQAWQDGRAGTAYRKATAPTAPLHPLPYPPGLVPVVLATPALLILTLGLQGLAGALGAGWGVMLAAGFAGWGGGRALALRRRFDARFYQANALFSELVGTGGGRLASGRRLTPEAVWWAPPRWRPAVWALLVQLDRRAPLGRYLALALTACGAALYLDAPALAVHAPLAVALALVALSIVQTSGPSVLMPAFALSLEPPGFWTVARTLVGLRWLPPVGLFVSAAAFLDAAFPWTHAAAWTLGAGLSAFGPALVVTLFAETRTRRAG